MARFGSSLRILTITLVDPPVILTLALALEPVPCEVRRREQAIRKRLGQIAPPGGASDKAAVWPVLELSLGDGATLAASLGSTAPSRLEVELRRPWGNRR